MEVSSEFDKKSICLNENKRNYLIATEASPSKMVNFKIDEVRSPEVRKCKSPVRCSMSSIKIRKKPKMRYSEPNKLNINVIKVDKNNHSPRDKNLLTKIHCDKIIKHETAQVKSDYDKGIIPVNNRQKIVCSVEVVNENISESNLTAVENRQKETDSSTRINSENVAETNEVRVRNRNVTVSSTIVTDQVTKVFNKSSWREIRNKDESCYFEVSNLNRSKCMESIPNTSTSNFVRSISIQNFESPEKCIPKSIDTSPDILEKPNEINFDNEENVLNSYDSNLFSTCPPLRNTDEKLSMENESIFCSPEISRPRKKRKNYTGSLVDRCYDISARVEKEILLFSYELESGLRANSGQFVSTDLFVISVLNQRRLKILYCKSCRNDEETFMYRILIILKAESQNVDINSVINVHFPVLLMLDLQINALLVFAGNRISVKSSAMSKVIAAETHYKKEKINLINDFFFKFHFQYVLENCMRVIHSNIMSNSIIECVLGEPLMINMTLEAVLLHLYKSSEQDGSYWKALLCDKENSYFILRICVKNEKGNYFDVMKVIELEGCKINLRGFKFINCNYLQSELLNLICYLHKNVELRKVIYEAEALTDNFNIFCVQKSLWPKSISSLSFIIAENKDFKRYSTRVDVIRMTCKGVLISDSSCPDGVLLNCTEITIVNIITTPFIVDSIFYLNGQLNSDIYSKIIAI